ncbi:hypothetical protein [Magnetovibrio blakemorei]|nr:hypothetical protein [Magnetovibrio blakemorei]
MNRELIGGLFGWGSIIASFASVYYLYQLMMNDGPAKPLIIATVVAFVCKGFARKYTNVEQVKSSRQVSSPALDIVGDYADYIAENSIGDEIRDVSALPHPKEDILQAMLNEARADIDENRREALIICTMMLADFQEGVGEKPLTRLGINLSAPLAEGEDIRALASRIANNPDKGRFDEFEARANAERLQISDQLHAAIGG